MTSLPDAAEAIMSAAVRNRVPGSHRALGSGGRPTLAPLALRRLPSRCWKWRSSSSTCASNATTEAGARSAGGVGLGRQQRFDKGLQQLAQQIRRGLGERFFKQAGR
jgi:hypothetical protein